ncbi:MAG TPA: DinB family protein [Patescibacteria group bacterium]|nr:DinB family protein [Patescibacteria group bacterium]
MIEEFKHTEKHTSHVPSLDSYERRIAEIKKYAEELVSDLTDAQFNKKPANGGWSVGECFEHMNILGKEYIAPLKKAIDTARKKGWKPKQKYKYSFFGRAFIRSMEPPYKMKLKTTKAMQTQDKNLSKEKVLKDFYALQEELLRLMREAQDVDLQRAKAPSQILPVIRFSVGEWLAVTAVHERRHLWQAAQVKKSFKKRD